MRYSNHTIPKFYYTKKWKRLRRLALERYGHQCVYCGGKAWQADHITPRSAGGKDVLDNLVACCSQCNEIAGGRVFKDIDEKYLYVSKARGK